MIPYETHWFSKCWIPEPQASPTTSAPFPDKRQATTSRHGHMGERMGECHVMPPPGVLDVDVPPAWGLGMRIYIYILYMYICMYIQK